MCGIAGIVHRDVQRYREKLPCMLDAISYRGPDDTGMEFFSNCALGHVRLSIVDLKNGHQPMFGNRKKHAIVFNGEIYGYQEIKHRVSDYPFMTDCDTEVLLALYEKYGVEMISQIPGMFAFAIWDEENQELFCARDRFGEKPFYYAEGRNGEFIFASEIKAILASGLVDPVVDEKQVAHFLNYSYVYPTRTIYKNISILPQGHQLIFKDGKIKVTPYWTLPTTSLKISENEAVEEFRKLFYQAVKRQLVADVPVGAFLSGGLDSGTVVAVAAEMVPKLTTISFAFREGVDESATAKTMADRYNTNHIEIKDLDFDICSMLHKMQEIFDEPFADPAAIPAYLIAKAARKHAKVVLTGDAGDELLGGYETKYGALAYMQEYRKSRVPISLLSWILKKKFLGERVLRKLRILAGEDMGKVVLQGRAFRSTEIKLSSLQMLHDNIISIKDYCRSRCMLSEYWNEHLNIRGAQKDYYIESGFLAPLELDNALRVDLQDYLPGNGFVKTDRTTMAVSLESRTPFCDKNLAEFCIRLPFDMKMRGMDNKYLLRKAFEDKWTLPVKNSVKNGFSPPFVQWLKEKSVLELMDFYLKDHSRKIFVNEFVDFKGVQDLLAAGNLYWPVWSMLQLSMWCESHPC